VLNEVLFLKMFLTYWSNYMYSVLIIFAYLCFLVARWMLKLRLNVLWKLLTVCQFTSEVRSVDKNLWHKRTHVYRSKTGYQLDS
jgi:hypothetical protein